MLKPNNQVTTDLIAARNLIADPKDWCQGAWSLGGRLCSVAALNMAIADSRAKANARLVLEEAARKTKLGWTAIGVNDTTDHATVMKMFDLAIEESLSC